MATELRNEPLNREFVRLVRLRVEEVAVEPRVDDAIKVERLVVHPHLHHTTERAGLPPLPVTLQAGPQRLDVRQRTHRKQFAKGELIILKEERTQLEREQLHLRFI